jgi:arabinogalactan endo-1,4-beta-galactosidase
VSKYTDELETAFGIFNVSRLARRYRCPVITFETQHAHALGWSDHRAAVSYPRDGERQIRTLRIRQGIRGLAESRAAHLEAAIKVAAEEGLGVEEWVPSGFPNAWIPADVKARIKAELKGWRQQRPKTESEKN